MKNQNNETRKEKHFFPRKLARSVAKANMKSAGIQKVNRHFALNWRNYVR